MYENVWCFSSDGILVLHHYHVCVLVCSSRAELSLVINHPRNPSPGMLPRMLPLFKADLRSLLVRFGR